MDQLEAVVIVLEETKVQKLMTSEFISCISKASLHVGSGQSAGDDETCHPIGRIDNKHDRGYPG